MVYEAVQENLGRRVAVKMLDPRLAEDREQLERFRREAEVVASLGHPNIVQVTDFQYESSANSGPFLVMELLRGDSLGARIERDGPMPVGRVAFVAAQALSALAAAHRAGVVHRDVKPDNIFLLAEAAVPDTVKVLDFGIAKLTASGQAKLTGTGTMLGTPAFMAPEQARGESDVDARADVYALGATMYQALTGKLPHEAASIPALLFAIVEKIPAPLGELRPDLPRDFVAVVERAMAKKRDERFPDADAMRRALSPWSGLPESAPAPISATAATVASGKIEPYTATPIVVGSAAGGTTQTPVVVTPNPTPSAASAQPATASEPKRGGPSLPLLATIVIVAGMAMTVGILALNRNKTDARPSAPPPIPSAVAVVPPPPPSPSASATPAPTPSATPSAVATASASATPLVAKAKRYGGKQGFASFYDFSGCPGCDWQSFKNDMGLQVGPISRCFAASEHEPPLHENPDFEFSVSANGAISALSDRDGSPKLEACLEKLVSGMRMTMSSPSGGSFRMGFRGECTPGWVNHCD